MDTKVFTVQHSKVDQAAIPVLSFPYGNLFETDLKLCNLNPGRVWIDHFSLPFRKSARFWSGAALRVWSCREWSLRLSLSLALLALRRPQCLSPCFPFSSSFRPAPPPACSWGMENKTTLDLRLRDQRTVEETTPCSFCPKVDETPLDTLSPGRSHVPCPFLTNSKQKNTSGANASTILVVHRQKP